MILFRNISIKSKLLIIILSSVLLSLVVASFIIVLLNYQMSYREFNNKLNVIVDITAERSYAGLVFGDKKNGFR